jgi:PAS domain S-box-containing protein
MKSTNREAALTDRELTILRLASEGRTDKGIADVLGISKGTVQGHWDRIRLKLGASSRTEAVASTMGKKTTELEADKQLLMAEVAEQGKHESALRQTQTELEVQVQHRTAELTQANEKLKTEIAVRESAEAALRESEEWHRTVLQTAMDGFCMVDMRGRLLDVNDAYCRMSGRTAEELLSMSVADLEVLDTTEEVIARIAQTKELGEQRFESRHRRKDGSQFDVEISLQYRPAREGRFVAFMRDVTTGKQAEKALIDAKRRLETMIEHPDGGNGFQRDLGGNRRLCVGRIGTG